MSELENQMAYLQDRWAPRFLTDPMLHAQLEQTTSLLAAIEDSRLRGRDPGSIRETAFYLVANIHEFAEQRARSYQTAEEHVARRRMEEAKLAALGEPPAYPLTAMNPELAELLGIVDEANRQAGEDK